MPSPEAQKFLDDLKARPYLANRVNWEQLGKDEPDLNIPQIRKDLEAMPLNTATIRLVQPDKFFVQEATRVRRDVQFDRINPLEIFAYGALRGITLKALPERPESKLYTGGEKILQGIAEFAGEMAPIVATAGVGGEVVGALRGVRAVKGLGLLESGLQRHVIAAAAGGGLYAGAKQVATAESLDPQKIMKEAFLWAGLQLGGEAVGAAVKNLASYIKYKRMGQSEALQKILAEVGVSKPLVEVDNFRRNILNRKVESIPTMVKGPEAEKGFVAVIGPTEKGAQAVTYEAGRKNIKVRGPRSARIVKTKTGRLAIRNPTGLGGGKSKGQPITGLGKFWPLSTDVILNDATRFERLPVVMDNALDIVNDAENAAREIGVRSTIGPQETQEAVQGALDGIIYLHSGPGFISDILKVPMRSKAFRELKTMFLAPHEVLPERIWQTVYDAQNTIDKMAAYYDNIYNAAEKVGISEGSEASRTIFKILNSVDNDLIRNESLVKSVPEELLSKLTPDQQKYIKIFKASQDELAEIRGLPSFQRIEKYITWIREDAKANKYYDVDEILKIRRKFLRRNIFDPFAQKRTSKGQGVLEDAVRAMRAYTYYGLKKGVKEPTIRALRPHLQVLEKSSPENYKYAFKWLSDWVGGTERKYPELANLADALRGRIYQGALFGNISASMTNLTQTLTATMPELGAYYTGRGTHLLTTKEGRVLFDKSGIMADYMHGRRIGTLDFFTRVEYVNRGISYLGALDKGLKKGQTFEEADRFARMVVEKTQFFSLGRASAPSAYRSGSGLQNLALQFTQYPLNMAKRLIDWGKNNPKKLLGWAAINVALGGPQALVPSDAITRMMFGDKGEDFLDEWRKRYSLGGLIGVNLAPRFGFGIFPNLPPAVNIAKDLYTLTTDLYGRFTSDVLGIDFQRDVVQSNLIQKDLPLMVKGGVQAKKFIEALGVPGSRYRYDKGQIIERRSNQPIGETTPGQRARRALVGESIKSAKERELISRTAQRRTDIEKARREVLNKIVGAFDDPDRMATKTTVAEGMKKLYSLGVTDFDRQKTLIVNEMLRQSRTRVERFVQSLPKQDRIKFMAEYNKIKLPVPTSTYDKLK